MSFSRRTRVVAARQPAPPAAPPQRVLLISLFHPELVRGGEQQICYELFNGLKQVPGVEPFLLASINASYPSLYKTGARITGFDERPNEFLYLSSDYDEVWHKTNSLSHLEVFAEFLRKIAPDVVNFHHFYSLGIDLLTLTRQVLPHCRIVFTFHEFLAICNANGHMVRTTDRSLCTHASPVRCHQCFPDHPPEHFLMRRLWFMRHLAQADAFTCPSLFMIDLYTGWGLPREKIFHVINGQTDYGAGVHFPVLPGLKTRFGFFGQLLGPKGILVLLHAVQILRREGFTTFSLDLNGDNVRYASEAVRNELEAFLLAEEQLPPETRLVFNNGSYQVDQLRGRMARVDWCIVPSLWWEGSPLVIAEAWMFHKPVIGSNVGAMKERMIDNVNGLLCERGDARALATVIRRAASEEGLWERLSAALPRPAPREAMVAAYLEVYRQGQACDVSGLPHSEASGPFSEASGQSQRP